MAVRSPLLDLATLHARLEAILASHRQDGPWAEPLVLSDDIQAFVIVHPPGTPNDTHYHEHDEWWVVLQGEIDWYIEGQAEPIRACRGLRAVSQGAQPSPRTRGWSPSPSRR